MIHFNKNACASMLANMLAVSSARNFYLMSGTKPTTEATSFSTTGYLATFSASSILTRSNDILEFSSLPGSFNAAITGYVDYALLVFNISTRVLVLDVGDTTTPVGHLILLSRDLVAGSPVIVVDFGLRITSL